MCVRDLRGMTEDRWTRRTAKPQQKHDSFQRFLQAAREASERPAVDCAKTDKQKMRICRIFSTGATGLEPATSGVTGRRSNQLNYAPGNAAV
jgi:hypothetical protein